MTNSKFVVLNTQVLKNGANGLHYTPPGASTAAGKLDVDRLSAFKNGTQGVSLSLSGAIGATLQARISNSDLSQNDVGLAAGAQGNALVLGIDKVYMSHNQHEGLLVFGSGVKAYLGKSEIIGNDTGLTIVNSATLFTYNDNRVEANTTLGVDGPVTVMTFR